jgi:uroporphyrinogen decarboxylase
MNESAFLGACRRERVSHKPVWFMRQVGRYMKEYQELRSRIGFLELCKRPDLACEATLMGVHRLNVDAAILFSDILLLAEALGFSLEYSEGKGPVIHNPFSGKKDLKRLRKVDPRESLGFVLEAILLVRRALKPGVPVIGFAGGPFTMAAYAIEGGHSRDFERTKTLMRSDPDTWHAFLGHLADATGRYLAAQVDAGAQAVQLFDTWMGALTPADYREYVQPHTQRVFEMLPAQTPAVHFGTGTGALLEDMKKAGGTVMGIDFRIPLDAAWKRLGDVPVQGNLDPTVLLCAPEIVEREAQRILDLAGDRPGHIFNLGHGLLPQTPPDHVRRLVDFVHERTAR